MKNKTSLFLLSMIVLLFLSSGKSQGQNCIDFTNFHSPGCTRTIGTFSNPYATIVSSYYNSDRHVVNTASAGYDPRTGYQLRIVPVGESASVRLGNPSTGSQAESISYTYTVDTNNYDLLFLKYAAVLQDPGHPQSQQPRLTLEILNTNNQQINPSCTYANFYASQSLGWNTYGNVVWKDWTTVGVDLSQYHGQTIKVRMTTYDCNYSGHYGYAYIILSCGKKSVSLLNPCNSVETVHFSAPAGFNYTWYNSSNSVISHSQDIVVPADNSSYRCVCSFVGNSSCSFEVYANSIAVGNNQTTTINQTLCKGETTDFGFIAQESGQHTRQLQSMHGCDSTVILNLTVPPTYNDTITAEICDNEVYTQFGFNVSEQGVYTQHLQSIHGCDSLVTLNLIVHPTFIDTIMAEICYNEVYTQNGFDTYVAGYHTQHLQSIHGCDSIIVLNLSVRPLFRDSITAEICDNEVYNQYGFTTSVAGIHTQYLRSIHGCDSIVTLNLVVHPTYNDTIAAEICDNEVYTQFGFNVLEQVVYTQHLQSIYGCDSLVTLNLIVHPTFNDTIAAEICDNEGYTQFGFNTSEAGYHTQTLQRENGCDSVIVLNLLVHPTFNDTIVAGICDNETYTQFGFNVSEQGVYTQHLQSIHGCDSLVTLNLFVHPTYNDTITAEICDNEVYTQFGFNTSEAGYHTLNLQSINGCDSIITLNLTVYPTFTDTTHVEICQGDRYQRDGFSAETTGIYVQNLQTTHGCDSVLVLDLVVFPTYLDTIIAETCEGIPYEQNGFYADRTGIYKQFLQTINGCDSTVVLNLRVNPIYNQDIEADICEDETYSFAGGTYSTQGVYEIRLQTEKGCDSLINLHLNVHSKYEQETDRRICQGETYIDRNFHESESGTYKAYYQSIWGCDSVIVLNLEVAPVYTDTIKAEIEYGQFYNDNGFFENERGSYVQYLTTEYGCDSIVVLWLEYLDRERKDIFAPNAITPQDETNNRFCVYPEDEEVIMEELVILNRNGAIIFSTKNFDECWNGKYKGEYVPRGVYKYMVVYHRVRTPDMKQRKIGSIMVRY